MSAEAFSSELPLSSSSQLTDVLGRSALEAVHPDPFVERFKTYVSQSEIALDVDTVTPEKRPLLAENLRAYAHDSAQAANEAEKQARIVALKKRLTRRPQTITKLHDAHRVQTHLSEFYERFASSVDGTELDGMARRRRSQVSEDSSIARSYWFKTENIIINDLSLRFRSLGNMVAHFTCEELMAAYGRDLLPFKRVET